MSIDMGNFLKKFNMRKIRKIINITLISTLILGGGIAYSAEISNLRIPLLFGDKKIINARVMLPVREQSKPDQVFTPREIILQQCESDIKHLYDVKERGLEALSPEAREVLYNPDKAEWMKNFTPMVFHGLYTFLKSPETRGLSFMQERPDLFNLGSAKEHEALGDFLRNIVKIAVSKLSQKDSITEIEATYRIKSETQKWLKERTGPEEISDFGQGDEHALTGNFTYGKIRDYIKESGKAFVEEYQLIGTGRYYILRGQTAEAVTQFKIALLTQIIEGHIVFLSGEKAEDERRKMLELQGRGLFKDRILMSSEDVDKKYAEIFPDKFNKEVISLIRQELLWMMENKIEGADKIIDALRVKDLIENGLFEELKAIKANQTFL
jgi:hypothetical protein